MPFPINSDSVNVQRSDSGKAEHIEHFQQPFLGVATEAAASLAANEGMAAAMAPDAEALARKYLEEVAPIYGLDAAELPGAGAAAFAADMQSQRSKLRLVEEKEVFDTTTVTYQQFFDGIPVWESGTSVTVQAAPMRVTASRSSVHQGIELPAFDQLAGPNFTPAEITGETARAVLGLPANAELTLNLPEGGGFRRYVYRYDPEKRFDPAAKAPAGELLQEAPPVLPLPPLPADIEAGRHYLVTEVLFTYTPPGEGPLNWRAFVEVQSGAVLYLRAFVACSAGFVFKTDPLTAGASHSATPSAGAAVLNPFRNKVPLQGLNGGNPQSLSGNYVEIVDNDPPAIVPPVAPNPPGDFDFDVSSRGFAAVNAYHHCDELFRRMEEMGFDVPRYFDGTSFPVPVDACAFNDALNARAPGNPLGTGSGGFQFGLAGGHFPCASIATDVRVVLHEFGHALLWDNVHSPNFGFAHSAGDALAAILMDPESALRVPPGRGATFPWLLPDRRHDREISKGWAWDGPKYNPFRTGDFAGYVAEQILSTTLFRLYCAIGGDSGDVEERSVAARRAIYLIFRAIGALGASVSPTPRPEIFATALMNADIGTKDFEGYIGGALHKVIRWSFEKQGLYQLPGTSRPVMREGDAPPVDLYINDGRGGEYSYTTSMNPEVWNRHTASPGSGPADHQPPQAGIVNHLFIRVQNRGSQPAANGVVRGHVGSPTAGLSWPGDFVPLGTPQISLPGPVPAGGSANVGPFAWQPLAGVSAILMEVSAPGDLSNIDARTFFPCATGPVPIGQLVPFDNNLAMRTMISV